MNNTVANALPAPPPSCLSRTVSPPVAQLLPVEAGPAGVAEALGTAVVAAVGAAALGGPVAAGDPVAAVTAGDAVVGAAVRAGLLEQPARASRPTAVANTRRRPVAARSW